MFRKTTLGYSFDRCMLWEIIKSKITYSRDAHALGDYDSNKIINALKVMATSQRSERKKATSNQ